MPVWSHADVNERIYEQNLLTAAPIPIVNSLGTQQIDDCGNNVSTAGGDVQARVADLLM